MKPHSLVIHECLPVRGKYLRNRFSKNYFSSNHTGLGAQDNKKIRQSLAPRELIYQGCTTYHLFLKRLFIDLFLERKGG